MHCTPTPRPIRCWRKGHRGEGNTYSTPVCIANAIADALDLDDVVLPMSPSKIADILLRNEPAPPAGADVRQATRPAGGRSLIGEGRTRVPASPQAVWDILLDPKALAKVISGCQELQAVGANAYHADVIMGVGPVRGLFEANVALRDLSGTEKRGSDWRRDRPELGSGGGTRHVTLEPDGDGTLVNYRYEVNVSGKVASVGGRMLDGAARILIGQFFNALVRQTSGDTRASLWKRLLRKLGLGK